MKNFVKNILGLMLVFMFAHKANCQLLKETISTNLGDSQLITASKLRNSFNIVADSVSSKASTLTLNTKLGFKAPVLNPVFQGDVELGAIGNGVIIKSPNGTRFRLTISNNGDIIAQSL